MDGFHHRCHKKEYKVLPFILWLESTLFKPFAMPGETYATKQLYKPLPVIRNTIIMKEAFIFSTEEQTDA